MELAGFVVVAVALVVAAALLARRGASPQADPALIQAVQGLTQVLCGCGGRRAAGPQPGRLARTHHGRGGPILQLRTSPGPARRVRHAQRALAESGRDRAGTGAPVEQARVPAPAEAVVRGRPRRRGEHPRPGSWRYRRTPFEATAFGSKIVEYALCRPAAASSPSTASGRAWRLLERLDTTTEPLERKRLVEQVGRDVRGKIRDMGKYLDPERTLSLGLLAVPDAVYEAAPEAHGEGYRAGVLVVPYSLALPYVLALYRLTVRFGCAVDTDQLADRIRGLEETLRQIDEEVEGRLSRGLVQAGNARDSLRDHLVDARRSTQKLLLTAESEAPSALGVVVGGPVAVASVRRVSVAEVD
jgi:hypothetical protein